MSETQRLQAELNVTYRLVTELVGTGPDCDTRETVRVDAYDPLERRVCEIDYESLNDWHTETLEAFATADAQTKQDLLDYHYIITHTVTTEYY